MFRLMSYRSAALSGLVVLLAGCGGGSGAPNTAPVVRAILRIYQLFDAEGTSPHRGPQIRVRLAAGLLQ